MRRLIFNTCFVLLLLSSRARGQEAIIIESEGETNFNSDTKAGEIVAVPNIESILYNPGVQKKQKSGKQIQATGYRETNETHFVVHFLKTSLHGEWQSYFNNNQPCDSGRFQKNLPDGEWKTWYANGQLKTVRNYSAKKFHYINADVKRNHPKDQRYQITKKARSGQNVNHHFMPVFETSLVNGNLPMLEKIKYNTSADGINYLAPFQHCLHHGTFMNYFENGLVKDSGYYKNGLKHELWKEANKDGNLKALGFYQHGLREGQWKFYDRNDQLVYTQTYKNGKKINEHYFRQKHAKP